MRRGVAIVALIFLFVLLTAGEVRPPPTRSVRELVLHADTIVLAEPVERPTTLARFKVLETLRGVDLKAGDILALDAGEYHSQDKRNALAIEQALLFLGPNRGTRTQPRFEPIVSGLRLWTRDRTLLAPMQNGKPGNYFLEERRNVDWSELIRQVRTDAEAVNDLFARKKLRSNERRNRALLEWVECHRHEFGAPIASEHPEKSAQGWGDLETQVFQWVLASGESADCWSAVKLYAELNRGAVPPLHTAAFGSRAGRALLLRVATANDALEGDRRRALTLLGHPLTLWPGAHPRLPRVQFVDAKEQADLIDRLTPLLTSKSAPLRTAAARTLCRVSRPEGLSGAPAKSQRALPALVKAFRFEFPGEPRDELAEAICALGGAMHWQELTGNPPGMVVLQRDLGRRENHVHFWLNLRPCGQVVYEQPALLLERINPLLPVALETKRLPLPVVNLPRPWSEGWDGGSVLLVEFSVRDLKPGSWRVSVQGTAGKDKDKQKWTAEPKTFLIDPPPKKNTGLPSYLRK